MEWQNASAATVATTQALGVARPAQLEQRADGAWRPRAGGRTPRSRARRAAPAAAACIALDVERARARQDLVAAQRVDGRGPVGHAVGVAPPQRREAGVEALGGRDDRADDDVLGQHARQPPHEAVPADARRRGAARARRRGRPGRGRARRRRCGPRPWCAAPRPAAAPRPRASSTTPWTVRRPGCSAQPEKSVPS